MPYHVIEGGLGLHQERKNKTGYLSTSSWVRECHKSTRTGEKSVKGDLSATRPWELLFPVPTCQFAPYRKKKSDSSWKLRKSQKIVKISLLGRNRCKWRDSQCPFFRLRPRKLGPKVLLQPPCGRSVYNNRILGTKAWTKPNASIPRSGKKMKMRGAMKKGTAGFWIKFDTFHWRCLFQSTKESPQSAVQFSTVAMPPGEQNGNSMLGRWQSNTYRLGKERTPLRIEDVNEGNLYGNRQYYSSQRPAFHVRTKGRFCDWYWLNILYGTETNIFFWN